MKGRTVDMALSEKLKALVEKYEQALAVDLEFDTLKKIYLDIKALKSKLNRANKQVQF